jgi:hypothetical protein
MERPFGLELRTERQLGSRTLLGTARHYTRPLITALGAFDEQRKFVLRLSEKTPLNRPRKIQKVTAAVEDL